MRVLASSSATRPVASATQRATRADDPSEVFGDHIAWRLMARWGYRKGGGLGKNGAGITTSDIVQPPARPIALAGLGFSGQDTALHSSEQRGSFFFRKEAASDRRRPPPDATGPGPPTKRRRLVRPPPSRCDLFPVPEATLSAYGGPPTDDLETPAWVLSCALSALRFGGRAVPAVVDPFYSTGAVVREWASIGVDCTQLRSDFFEGEFHRHLDRCTLVTFPPISKLEIVFNVLSTVDVWCLLVPRAFTESDAVRTAGGVALVHIVRPVSFSYAGHYMGTPRSMSWVFKGVDLPSSPLYTHDASTFWSVETGETFTSDLRPASAVEHSSPAACDALAVVASAPATNDTARTGTYTDEPSEAWRHLRRCLARAVDSSDRSFKIGRAHV